MPEETQPPVGWFESPEWNWTSPPTEPGWYSVTGGSGIQQRFWDGTEWTAERKSETLQTIEANRKETIEANRKEWSGWNPGGGIGIAAAITYQNRDAVLDWLALFAPPAVAVGLAVLLVVITGVLLGLGFRIGWGFASKRLKS
jgi:hypothetical protein